MLSRGRPPVTRARVLTYWRKHGPCSVMQIVRAFQADRRHIQRIIQSARLAGILPHAESEKNGVDGLPGRYRAVGVQTKIIPLGAGGNRMGEHHPRATLTDGEVELIRELACPTDSSIPLSHRKIAEKFEISRGTVGDIVSFRRRGVTPTGYKRVHA